MKAYITCPVSHTKKRLEVLLLIGKVLKSRRIRPFIFKVGGEPADIFKRDYKALKSSDILIAEVSERSHGVGVEIGLSFCFGLKRILLIEKGNFVSKLIQGIPQTEILEYSGQEDMESKLAQALDRHIK